MIENNKTQVLFQLCKTKANLGSPAAGTIVFIQDTKELYLDGIYYGLSTTDAATLAKAVTDISGLNTTVNDHLQLTQGLVDYVKNLRKFADGADANSTEGPVLTTHNSGVLQGKDNVKTAIDALAAAVDTLTGHTWKEVTKPSNAGQFATSVKQKTDGSIEVSYADVKSTDVKRDANQNGIGGATVEDALVTLKNAAATAQAKADKNETAIGVINGDGKGSISKAVSDAKSELMGTGEGVWEADEVKTLTKLRDLIKANAAKISTLQGVDDGTAAKLEAIVNELKNADGNVEGFDFANTLLDKFLTLYGTPDKGEYTVNSGKQTTLQGIINAIETRITNVNNTLSGNLTSTIEGLDATVRGQLTEADKVETGKHVGVKVVETNGKLTGVTVVENDIASAQALGDLASEVTTLKETVANQGSQLTWKVIS